MTHEETKGSKDPSRFAGARAVHYLPADPGCQWKEDPNVTIDLDTPLVSWRILTPNVIHVPSGGYRMYYMGFGPGRPIKTSR